MMQGIEVQKKRREKEEREGGRACWVYNSLQRPCVLYIQEVTEDLCKENKQRERKGETERE